MITYGDSITGPPEPPLASLNEFVEQRLSDVISDVHILPFFPSSSDDGFAVKDYLSVDGELGQWSDIELICENRALLVDLVINHCSSEHPWFEQFKSNASPGKDFFVEVDPLSDLSKVVRPRTSELLRKLRGKTEAHLSGAHLAMIKSTLILQIPRFLKRWYLSSDFFLAKVCVVSD